MSDEANRLMAVFLDVQRGLPRQGPGAATATREALALCGLPPGTPRILDIGCGPGLQTLVLAEATGGEVVAVDFHREYLTALADRAAAAGVAARVRPLQGDMARLPFPDAAFDLIWSEGAAYIMGVAEAFAEWRRLVKPGGCIALSELAWLRPDPPAEAAAFFAEEYPAMTDIAGNWARLSDAGLDPVGRFTLPDDAWWDDYYRPLEAKLPALRATYAGDAEALSVIAGTEQEIAMRRRYPDSYGYVFLIGRRPG